MAAIALWIIVYSVLSVFYSENDSAKMTLGQMSRIFTGITALYELLLVLCFVYSMVQMRLALKQAQDKQLRQSMAWANLALFVSIFLC